MKLGLEDKKKTGILIGLSLVVVYLMYTNLFSSPSGPASEATRATAPAVELPTADSPRAEQAAPPRAPSRARGDEFHPVLHSKRPEDRIDPMTVDPTLRLDLLAKVQAVDLAGGNRNVFQFSTPPVKEVPKDKGPKIPLKPVTVTAVPKPPVPAGPPPPPPINLKYYGYSSLSASGSKTAFFLDGEDILVAHEGETLKRRYKVVSIGVNSVVMEDVSSKRQETLPLTADLAG
ncbi:MAG TPA: hypothetical protein VG675_04925 [Bryobacteraceae bacterium]|nr:hypothetical protein [Bryobacteraceae bacterium]